MIFAFIFSGPWELRKGTFFDKIFLGSRVVRKLSVHDAFVVIESIDVVISSSHLPEVYSSWAALTAN